MIDLSSKKLPNRKQIQDWNLSNREKSDPSIRGFRRFDFQWINYYHHHRRWHDAYLCVTRASSFLLSRQKDERIANKPLERCARNSIDPRWFTSPPAIDKNYLPMIASPRFPFFFFFFCSTILLNIFLVLLSFLSVIRQRDIDDERKIRSIFFFFFKLAWKFGKEITILIIL